MDKWLAIAGVGVVFAMFSPVMVSEYSKGQCRVEAIKANVEPEKIVQVCK